MAAVKKILITGGTGLLGKGMEETAPAGWRILGVHQRDYAVEDAKAKHIVLDIREKRAVDRLFEKHRFDAVVHAAGIASVDFVEKNYAESLESNLVGTLNVCSAARRAGVHLIYVSTNAVFDGTHPPYKETSLTKPVNKYGQIKVECERLVTETLPDSAIMRPILMYGWNHPVTRPNPATWIHDKLMRGETVELVDDVTENPLYNISCGEALWAMTRKKVRGVFHVAGKDAMNRWKFGLALAKTFGFDARLIKRVDSSRFPGIAKRPANTTLSTARMERELGVAPLSVADGLRAMKAAMRIRA
ncbi:MAG: SDR family oxidoreductase [Elusimicrobia bacterium]|nr:SDR family oxidoreductase [Elusimicrobiota bacterium]